MSQQGKYDVVESVFNISALVKKRRNTLQLIGHYFPSPDLVIFSIVNEKEKIHSVEIGRDGHVWCNCEFWIFRKNKLALCGHTWFCFCWLLDEGREEFVTDVCRNYLLESMEEKKYEREEKSD